MKLVLELRLDSTKGPIWRIWMNFKEVEIFRPYKGLF